MWLFYNVETDEKHLELFEGKGASKCPILIIIIIIIIMTTAMWSDISSSNYHYIIIWFYLLSDFPNLDLTVDFSTLWLSFCFQSLGCLA